jgi:hypothetical protein
MTNVVPCGRNIRVRVSPSWCRAPSGAHEQILITVEPRLSNDSHLEQIGSRTGHQVREMYGGTASVTSQPPLSAAPCSNLLCLFLIFFVFYCFYKLLLNKPPRGHVRHQLSSVQIKPSYIFVYTVKRLVTVDGVLD